MVEAAVALFTTQGLDAPSLDAICERAGCTRGAFYVHFRDRDELIAAAMTARRHDVLGTLLGAPDLSIERVLELFASAVESGAFPPAGAVRSGELVQACRRSKTVRTEQHRLIGDTLARVTARVERGQADGSTRSDIDARSLALVLLLAEAGAELWLDLGVSFDVRSAANALSALLTARS
ncbi:MAG TPA: TetR/AcrR family transcriptional regulator [Polyangiaceae bacterium]|nr:TetR/AcrR family transcriptional regulator [Polyangiaceae bacterium]